MSFASLRQKLDKCGWAGISISVFGADFSSRPECEISEKFCNCLLLPCTGETKSPPAVTGSPPPSLTGVVPPVVAGRGGRLAKAMGVSTTWDRGWEVCTTEYSRGTAKSPVFSPEEWIEKNRHSESLSASWGFCSGDAVPASLALEF